MNNEENMYNREFEERTQDTAISLKFLSTNTPSVQIHKKNPQALEFCTKKDVPDCPECTETSINAKNMYNRKFEKYAQDVFMTLKFISSNAYPIQINKKGVQALEFCAKMDLPACTEVSINEPLLITIPCSVVLSDPLLKIIFARNNMVTLTVAPGWANDLIRVEPNFTLGNLFNIEPLELDKILKKMHTDLEGMLDGNYKALYTSMCWREVFKNYLITQDCCTDMNLRKYLMCFDADTLETKDTFKSLMEKWSTQFVLDTVEWSKEPTWHKIKGACNKSIGNATVSCKNWAMWNFHKHKFIRFGISNFKPYIQFAEGCHYHSIPEFEQAVERKYGRISENADYEGYNTNLESGYRTYMAHAELLRIAAGLCDRKTENKVKTVEEFHKLFLDRNAQVLATLRKLSTISKEDLRCNQTIYWLSEALRTFTRGFNIEEEFLYLSDTIKHQSTDVKGERQVFSADRLCIKRDNAWISIRVILLADILQVNPSLIYKCFSNSLLVSDISETSHIDL